MDQPDLYASGPYLASLRYLPEMLDKKERQRLVRQLMATLDDYYVHLPQKSAAFAINPVQALRILHDNDDVMNDNSLSLHAILRILNGLRDRHTALLLPPPWNQLTAYLPILVERYYVNRVPRYVISKKLFGFVDDRIQPGSHITHWNGMPIQAYLENVLGPLSQGSNPAASLSLALASLTIRPLGYSLLPDEDWVTLSCLTEDGAPYSVSLAWKYFLDQPAAAAPDAPTSGAAARLDVGFDERMDKVNTTVNRLFVPPNKRTRGPRAVQMQELDGILKYGTIDTLSGPVGYVRLYSFQVGDVDTFLAQMVTVLSGLPQDRLIVDIRNNPGGVIPAGQCLVQMLSKKPIQVAPVTFRSTGAVRPFGELQGLEQWAPSLNKMAVSAENYAQLFPLTDLAQVPPYRYPGRSTLIIDALCYSTSDFFAADFKDNRVGEIIGTDRCTGAGGANVWNYDILRGYARLARSVPLEPLPQGMGLNVSMRRSVRTGAQGGLPIENFGVDADVVYYLTLDDLLFSNVDLLNFAAARLSQPA